MQFETLTVNSIKSITQRRLLWYWNELAAGRRFPVFSDFQIDARMHDPKQLLIWSIEHDGGHRKFRSRLHGAMFQEVFRSDWLGKTMDEVVPECLRQYALDTAEECAGSGCAVFSILSTVDAAGHRVDCERLLLPFGSGTEVEQMVGSMQLISLKGDYARGTVLEKYRMTSKVELAGRIAAGFRTPEISRPGLVIELERAGAPTAAQ